MTQRVMASSSGMLISCALALALLSCGGSDPDTPPAAKAPVITAQPQDRTVTAGQGATFTVAATGAAPLSYQWRQGGTPVSGATGASFAIASAQSSDAGIYTVTVSNAVAAVTSSAATLTVLPGSSFRDDFSAATLDPGVWQVAAWAEHGGQTDAARCYAKDGFLTMEFENDAAYFAAHGLFLSSALQTRATFLYGRWEARLKPSSVPGVLNSFYTIDWGDGSGTKQEIDIEFLTKSFGGGGGEVHYAVHAEGKTSFNTNPDVSLAFDPSADFHVYAIEITPTEIQWTVDGTLLKTYAYSDAGVTINAPYQLKLNAWSQANWIGGPPVADTVCTYLIDWIQFTPMEN